MEFVKPRNKSSKVWKYFGQRLVDGKLLTKEEVVCLVCYNTYRTCGSTSPMFSHLMKMHPNEYSQINNSPPIQRPTSSIALPNVSQADGVGVSSPIFQDASRSENGLDSVSLPEVKCFDQSRTQASSSVLKLYDQNDNRQRKITNLLVDVIIENMLPTSVVNSNSFCNLMTFMDSSYIIPDKKTISKVFIPNRSIEVKDALKLKLSNLTSFSYAINRWTSSQGNVYLMFSVHSISESWAQSHYLLDVLHLPQDLSYSHITKLIAQQTQDLQTEYIPVIAATADGDSNMVFAIRSLGHLQLPCLANVIHEAVTAEIFEVSRMKEVVEKCKQIAPLLHHSAAMRGALTSGQLERGDEIPAACPIANDRRWNSVYHLLIYMKKYLNIINDVLFNYGHKILVLSEDERERVSECCSILRPLAEATDLLANEQYVTSSTVMPFLDILKTGILAALKTDSPEVIELKESLIRRITGEYVAPERRNLLLQCSFVDPRFKDLSYLNNEEKLKVRDAIYSRAKLVGVTGGAATPPPTKKPKSSLGQLFSIRGQKDFSSAEDLYDPLDEEISAYINNECVFEIDGDHLQWWNNRKKTYPVLSQVARQLLSIPATSAPSEYCFKKHGDLLLRKRSCLSPKSVQMVTFLNENM